MWHENSNAYIWAGPILKNLQILNTDTEKLFNSHFNKLQCGFGRILSPYFFEDVTVQCMYNVMFSLIHDKFALVYLALKAAMYTIDIENREQIRKTSSRPLQL